MLFRFFNEGNVYVGPCMEGIGASHRPEQQNLFAGGKLMQRFLQFFANFLAELFPALPSPLFSSFQQGRHSLIIGPETCLTETTPKPGAVPLKLQNVSILDALDFLSLRTESLWELVDGSTIAAAPGNHRSFSRWLSP